MGTDRLIRGLTTMAVLLVAAIAACVSYLHIEHLALAHGQEMSAAVLLPVSIDGTVAAASLVMLRAARSGMPTPSLARFMLVLSVTATLMANVAYGAPFGLTGALISGWPAVAFVGCVEMTIGMVRKARILEPEPVMMDDENDEEDEPVMAAVPPVAEAVETPEPVTPSRPRPQQRRNTSPSPAAIRAQRSRAHKSGDHSLCRPERDCRAVTPAMVEFTPEPVPVTNGHAP